MVIDSAMQGTGAMNDALVFYEYLSQHFKMWKALESFTIKSNYAYKSINANRDVFIELENNVIKIGYKGIAGTEKELSALLNHRHFDKFFSELVVDIPRDKIYKNYLVKHDVLDDMANFMEMEYIVDSLSMLEHRAE